ncbi:tyrosine-type recombinase/integrase [Methanobrevibacter sp.]|uniref:tyrosine-type recombinase/integrase n=1 Tax=Methanobrevibacter sp. TaxID=66852 RepID=UPI0038906A2E
MKFMKTTDQILSQFFYERNSSQSTILNYSRGIKHFENYTGKTLPELLNIADAEETNNISWKNSTLRPLLIDYRIYLFDKYMKRTAELYLMSVITVFRHFEINIPRLPYFSMANVKKPTPILPNELPDRELLKHIIEIKNPLLKAITLFMSSSGVSRVDTLKITIKDYLKFTKEFHHSEDIFTAIEKMKDSEIDIIPTFYLKRQKTNQNFYTFCSPEAVEAINNYLYSRTDDFNKNNKLFKIQDRYLNKIFKEVNDQLGLGKAGTYSRFAPHMLRRYHATQLAEAGMSLDKINLLEGRKVHGVAHESYIRIKPEVLKEEYIKCLPYLVVEDINKVRTKLDVAVEENENLQSENDTLKSELNDIRSRQDDLEKLVRNSIGEERLSNLNKLL